MSIAMNELFRTPVPVSAINAPIKHLQQVLMIGSCFSENIFFKLASYRFKVKNNPTGILYNPLSITAALKRILQGTLYSKEELFFHEGLWKSLDHHSKFSSCDIERCLDQINTEFSSAVDIIKNTDMIILTFGSSFVYQLQDSRRVVANCHKLPDQNYTRRLASIEEIVDCCSDVFRELLLYNPALQIILTVSPVRHLRDKPQENSVSKAHLVSAVYELQNIFDSVHYFPAYEIVLDELRDYRFFAADMIHPSDVAVNFIWERFRSACIDRRSNRFIDRYEHIIRAREHTFHFPDSDAANEFRAAQVQALDQLQNEFPEIDFTQDYKHFRN